MRILALFIAFVNWGAIAAPLHRRHTSPLEIDIRDIDPEVLQARLSAHDDNALVARRFRSKKVPLRATGYDRIHRSNLLPARPHRGANLHRSHSTSSVPNLGVANYGHPNLHSSPSVYSLHGSIHSWHGENAAHLHQHSPINAPAHEFTSINGHHHGVIRDYGHPSHSHIDAHSSAEAALHNTGEVAAHKLSRSPSIKSTSSTIKTGKWGKDPRKTLLAGVLAASTALAVAGITGAVAITNNKETIRSNEGIHRQNRDSNAEIAQENRESREKIASQGEDGGEESDSGQGVID